MLISCAEEWQKATKAMETELASKPAGYVGARVSKHFLTDCYSKGVTRGAVECANLLTRFKPHDPVAPETIRTASTINVSTSYAVNLVESACTGQPWPSEPSRLRIDQRSWTQKQVTTLPWWTAYGNRGKDERVHELSAFEFARLFQIQPASHPVTVKEQRSESYHAVLTETGVKKLQEKHKPRLQPELDYRIKDDTESATWIAMGTGDMVRRLRHDWIIAPRGRPAVPVVHAPWSRCRNEEDQAKLLIILFCPFTLNEADADENIPFIQDLKTENMRNWMHALRVWLHRGLPTDCLRRWVANFCFVYFNSRAPTLTSEQLDNSDNDLSSDEEVDFDDEDLLEAVNTYVKGAGKAEHEEASRNTTKQHASTMEAFSLAHRFWLQSVPDNKEAKDRYHRICESERHVDAVAALKAAKDSRRQAAAQTDSRHSTGTPIEPSVTKKKTVSRTELHRWLFSDEISGKTNSEQHAFLTVIVNRIIQEYNLGSPIGVPMDESPKPLAWLLHGAPGTGKTHVLPFLRQLFRDLLDYQEGIDFIVTTFQAVNAADVQGTTIHQAFGLTVAKYARSAEVSIKTSKRLAQLRWIIIDEISMVSARLLCQVEHRLRDIIATAAQFKCDADGQARPFAGINMIFIGDFHQLPPPEGGFIADIPHKYRSWKTCKVPDITVESGKNLFWEGAVQGVTELHEKERCKDAWWNEVVDELRAGWSGAWLKQPQTLIP